MTRSRLLALLFLCLLSSAASAQVTIPDEPSDDPAVEERLARLSHELRCLQCKNQTLADSPSSIAADLRREIRTQIKAGKSDEEIIAFLRQRYGDFILFRPRVRPTTYILWFGPFVLLAGGLFVLFRYVKQRRDAIAEQPLTAEERRRAEEMLRS